MQSQKVSDMISKDDGLIAEADSDYTETPTKPSPKTSNKRVKKASPQKALVLAPVAKFSGNELTYDSLLIFMNHPKGMAAFNKQVSQYKSEPAPMYFVKCLRNVMKENSAQTDPLGICSAWDAWNAVRPAALTKHKDLSHEDQMLKDAVDNRFRTYIATLRSTNILSIPVRVFCHMCCKNGCPTGFEGFNDRGFREENMESIVKMLKGEGEKPWNNIHNASMHMMLKWKDKELRALVSPDTTAEEWKQLNPKQIGVKLEEWFESLDNEELEEREDLKDSQIPKAGQHRSGGIPRWVEDQDVEEWQAVLGTHLQMNFWLHVEQLIANYLSGVSV